MDLRSRVNGYTNSQWMSVLDALVPFKTLMKFGGAKMPTADSFDASTQVEQSS